jgi:hypothetical protein
MLKKLKALWAVKKFYDWFTQNYRREVTTMDNQVKAGWKTTEFWMTLITNLVAVLGALNGVIPADTMAIILAVVNGVYGVLRALVKQPDITTLTK